MRSLLRPAAASRRAVIATVALVFSLAIVARAMAQNHAPVFPDLIQLPADVGAEGIAAGNGHTFYVGSLAPDTLGQILVGDLRTGTVFELVPPIGRPAGGLKFDSRSQYLFVAGGDSASVYNTRSGAEVVSYQFVPPGVAGIINDVVVTRDAAYFTESLRPFLGRVTLNHQGEPLDAELIPLPANTLVSRAVAPWGLRYKATGSLRRPTAGS